MNLGKKLGIRVASASILLIQFSWNTPVYSQSSEMELLASLRPVDDAMLSDPSEQDWLIWRRNYAPSAPNLRRWCNLNTSAP